MTDDQSPLRRLATSLLPKPKMEGPYRPLPKRDLKAQPLTPPEQGIDMLLGALGISDPLAPEASLATGIGSLAGLLSPLAVAGGLKRVANPIKAYHGSPNRTLKTLSPREALEVPGSTWFSSNPDVAEQYTYPREYGEIMDAPRGKVYEVNIHAENPMEVDMQGKVGEAISWGKLVNAAKARQHDALILKNVDDTVDSSRQMGTSYAVWNPDILEILRKYGILPPIAAATLPQGKDKQ